MPNWIEPYYENVLFNNGHENITSLVPLQYGDGSPIKIKLHPDYNCGDPFVVFWSLPEIVGIIKSNSFLVPGISPAHYSTAINIDLFIKMFNDKSAYISNEDFVTKSNLKAINKKARQWRNAGAEYILIY